MPDFQVVPETEVENLMIRDSERVFKESWKPRLNFNLSFTNGVNSERHRTETLVLQDPLILGGGTTSDSPSNTYV